MKQSFSLLLILALFLSACRNDTFEENIIEVDNNQEVFEEGDVVGIVTNEEGEFLPGVVIKIDNESIYSDQNGYFRINGFQGNSNGSLISFCKEGYFDGYKFVYTSNKEDALIHAQLVKKVERKQFQSQNGAEVTVEAGAKVNIPPNAIIDEHGNSYDGEVRAFMHYYDPESFSTIENMPGDLRGINSTGLEVQLATFGMIAVELETQYGESLQLGKWPKSNHKITLVWEYAIQRS